MLVDRLNTIRSKWLMMMERLKEIFKLSHLLEGTRILFTIPFQMSLQMPNKYSMT